MKTTAQTPAHPLAKGERQALLTSRELQARWRISAQTLWRLQKKGIIAPCQFGSRKILRFSMVDIEAREAQRAPVSQENQHQHTAPA